MTKPDNNFKILPWDGPEHAQKVPWHLHRWYASVARGSIYRLDAKIYHDKKSGKWVREEEYINRLTGSDIHIFEKSDLEQIFRISATDGCHLMAAVRKHVGEDRFSKHWLEQEEDAPAYYADPRYAVDESETPKRKPGRPKKVTQEA